jgi:hypothetical protein
MAHLTERYIDSLVYSKPAPARAAHWDDELRGFGVRVYPNGEKSYVSSCRHQGKSA